MDEFKKKERLKRKKHLKKFELVIYGDLNKDER